VNESREADIYQRFLKMQVLNVFFLPKIVLKKFTIELAIPHFFKTIVFKNKYVLFLAFPRIFGIYMNELVTQYKVKWAMLMLNKQNRIRHRNTFHIHKHGIR
jgi:hypothetical protein